MLELLYCLVFLNALMSQVRPEIFDRHFKDDLFHVIAIDTYHLQTVTKGQKKSEMDNLNDLLEDRTDSENPDENLDIIDEEFISDLKKKVSYDSLPVQAKRLVLALRTLKGENECNYYSHEVLLSNLLATGNRIRILSEDKLLRRIDRILRHYVDRHVENCEQVYFKKFDELSKNLDPSLARHIDIFLRNQLDIRTSNTRIRNGIDKTYIERLYWIASDGDNSRFKIEPAYLYDALNYFAKGDPEVSSLKPIKDDQSGELLKVNKQKLWRLFKEYIANPCHNYRQQLGPDVFEPVSFDRMFKDYQLGGPERVGFYEAWLKYRLCNFFGETSYTVDSLMEYINRLSDQ